MPPGLIVVASGTQLREDTFPIPDGGLVFGRDHADPSDDRISRRHARIAVEGDDVAVIDLGSRNGTFVNTRPLLDTGIRPVLPAVMRTGRTVSVIAGDLGAPLALDAGDLLARARREVAEVAIGEDNLAVFGPPAVGRELAGDYARSLGGEVVVVELGAQPFGADLAGKRPRTIVLVLARPLDERDLPELAQWLETDVRIGIVARTRDSLGAAPVELADRLAMHAVDVPARFLHEVPTAIGAHLQRRVPQTRLHPSLFEHAVLRARETSHANLFAELDAFVDDELRRAGPQDPPIQIRGDDFLAFVGERDALLHQHAFIGVPRRRRNS